MEPLGTIQVLPSLPCLLWSAEHGLCLWKPALQLIRIRLQLQNLMLLSLHDTLLEMVGTSFLALDSTKVVLWTQLRLEDKTMF